MLTRHIRQKNPVTSREIPDLRDIITIDIARLARLEKGFGLKCVRLGGTYFWPETGSVGPEKRGRASLSGSEIREKD